MGELFAGYANLCGAGWTIDDYGLLKRFERERCLRIYDLHLHARTEHDRDTVICLLLLAFLLSCCGCSFHGSVDESWRDERRASGYWAVESVWSIPFLVFGLELGNLFS